MTTAISKHVIGGWLSLGTWLKRCWHLSASAGRLITSGRDSLALWKRSLGEIMRSKDVPPDLHTQLEELLDQVWDSERRERVMDRILAASEDDPKKPEPTRPAAPK